jgi:hypothetical protein
VTTGEGVGVAEAAAPAVGDPVVVTVAVSEGVGVAEAAAPADGDPVRVFVLVTVADDVRVGVRVGVVPPLHDVADMTMLSMRNEPVAPSVPDEVPRRRKAKPAAPFAAALKAIDLQQYHPAAVDVATDAGVPSGVKGPAAPVVESCAAQTFGPVAL